MRRLAILLLLIVVQGARSQTPAGPLTPPAPTTPAPLLSPQAAYDQASAPVDIVHRDLNNWSDTEAASLKVAVAQASAACVARASETFTGDDLVAYARLCALGKQWSQTYTAATMYINSKDAQKPLLAMAYTFEVQADLNMNHEKAALGACVAMLRSVPYDALTDEVTTTTIRYMEFAYTPDAIELLSTRQPFLLDLLRAAQANAVPSPAATALPQPIKTSAIPLHTLFEHALDYAAVEQYDNHAGYAAVIVKDIDEATPSTLPPDEGIFIAADRRQYALLGTRFPALPGAVSLLSTTETPVRQPNFGSADVFLLFPPWCAQCIHQAQDIVSSLVRIAILRGSDKIYVYALLADKPTPAALKLPPPKPPPTPARVRRPGQPDTASQDTAKVTETFTDPVPQSAEEQLRKTPTLVVAPSTLTDFNASDFPFLIATDHDGVIRLMVPAAPANALFQGGPVEQITDTILANWPAQRPTPPPPAPPPSAALPAPPQ